MNKIDGGAAALSKSKHSLFFSTLKMALATLTSRILGLVRELVMAAVFGATGLTDAFLVAYRIPNILRDLLAEGAFSSAFVPTFTEVRQRDPHEARELLWSLFIFLSIVTSLIGLLYAIFAPEIILAFAPDFERDPERFQLSVNLLRLMAPFLLCASLAALFMGALNSLKVFFIPSVAPASANVFMILTIFFLAPFLKIWGYPEVFALAIGVLLGGVSQILIQLPSLLKKNYGPIWPKVLFPAPAKKVVTLLGPGLVGLTATQLNVLVTTSLASSTIGAVSWLNYAFRLFQFPVGILSVSIAGTNLVHFSEAWKLGLKEKAGSILQTSYFFSWLTIVPSTVLLYALSTPSVHLILQRGKFSLGDTHMTSVALKLYALGLPFYGIYKIMVPVFYSIDRQRIPVVLSLVCVGINIAFCLLLVPHFGFKILPLGTTLSMLLNSFFLCFSLKKIFDLPLSFFINIRLIKVIFAGALSFLALQTMENNFFHLQDSFLFKATVFSLIAAGGVLVYLAVLLVTGEGKILREFWQNRKSKKGHGGPSL